MTYFYLKHFDCTNEAMRENCFEIWNQYKRHLWPSAGQNY